MDLILLFVAALLAATLLPAQSEAVLVGLHLAGEHSAATLVAVATLGNVLGSCINWLLGRFIEQLKHKRWFPVKAPTLARATRTYQRYGVWSLLLAWVPMIGDPLTVIAGIMRTPFALFVLLVTIGKLSRYVILVAAL